MKLPTSLTTVTSLSRVFAAILFILFPFLGFFIGIRFQSNLDDAYAYQNKPAVSVDRANPTLVPTAKPTPTVVTTANSTFTNNTYKYTVTYPNNIFVGRFLKIADLNDKDSSVFFGTKDQADFINNLNGGIDGNIKIAYLTISATKPQEGINTSTCVANTETTTTSTCKVVTVGGIKGLEYTTKRIKEPEVMDGGFSVGDQIRATYFQRNGVYYQINVYDKNNDYTIANNIINSFKFN